MKKIFLLILLIFSLGSAAQQVSPPMVTVTGTGTVKVVPDQVVIRARVEHTGKSPSQVKAQNDEVVNEVLQFLKNQGIDSRNFKTEYMTLNKDYNYSTKETFYSANQAISIRLENLEKYENLMSGLLESGLNRIDGVQFGSSKKKELESQARKLAVIDAKTTAQTYARALDQKIGKAQFITEIEGGNIPPMYRVMEMKSSDVAAEETIAPGELEITVKVNAGFLLL